MQISSPQWCLLIASESCLCWCCTQGACGLGHRGGHRCGPQRSCGWQWAAHQLQPLHRAHGLHHAQVGFRQGSGLAIPSARQLPYWSETLLKIPHAWVWQPRVFHFCVQYTAVAGGVVADAQVCAAKYHPHGLPVFCWCWASQMVRTSRRWACWKPRQYPIQQYPL